MKRERFVFVVVDKHGNPCSGNIFMGLSMPVAEFKGFLSEGRARDLGGEFRVGVKRWIGGERVVKMKLVYTVKAKPKSKKSGRRR